MVLFGLLANLDEGRKLGFILPGMVCARLIHKNPFSEKTSVTNYIHWDCWFQGFCPDAIMSYILDMMNGLYSHLLLILYNNHKLIDTKEL